MSHHWSFVGGRRGPWKVTQMSAFRGAPLEAVERIEIINGHPPTPGESNQWSLQGFTSNVRYATGDEIKTLKNIQPALGRPEATCAALIPIKKNEQWWDLAQDARRAIFEETSQHNAIGLTYLPAIARRLHHSRDLGEPFDFLTWFEFAPEHIPSFNELLAKLRATKEWSYVEREVDIRLTR